ncbi:31070_t:CDS:1, partial [Gigaspora margarita]
MDSDLLIVLLNNMENPITILGNNKKDGIGIIFNIKIEDAKIKAAIIKDAKIKA